MKFTDTHTAPSCEETTLLLSRGLDCDLSGTEVAVMYAHVAGCDAGRLAMGEMATLAFAMQALNRQHEALVLDDGFTTELTNKLAAVHNEGGVTQLRQFGRHAAQDAALRDRLQRAKDQTSFIQLCVQLGQESGYRFTTADVALQLESKAANDDCLSDAQLDKVAAGGGFDGRQMLDLLNGLND